MYNVYCVYSNNNISGAEKNTHYCREEGEGDVGIYNGIWNEYVG
jgi:hypothetical protein